MKKVVHLICIIAIIAILIMVLIPNKSYGICNTIRFSKEVNAIQLILADGSVLYDLKIDKNPETQTNLLPASYKNLNLIFVVETENGVEENKTAIKNFINSIYSLYGENASKIQMGIIPFEDLSQSEVSSRTETINTSENILKNSQSEILNEVENLQQNSKRTLQEALITVQGNFLESDSSNNDSLLQYMILITDGIENGDINVNIDGIEQNMLEASNVILQDLSNTNMVAMYGLIIGTNKVIDRNLEKLFDKVFEMVISEDVMLQNVSAQLQSNVYDYINQFIIRESTLIPTSEGNLNVLLSSDLVVLTADAEILHGATLKIEYTMSVSRYAAYGSGQIYSSKILDIKDDRLNFYEDAKLLTEPEKTNADYGWKMTDEGLITEEKNSETKLVLSTLLTPQQLDNARYGNTAKCSTSFDVGSGSTASYTLTDKALDVLILPPFGNEEQTKGKNNVSTYIISGAAVVALIGLSIITKKSIDAHKRNKNKKM